MSDRARGVRAHFKSAVLPGGKTMLAPFKALWADESGQDLVEYALLVALIAIIVIAALKILGPIIATVFNNIATNLQNAGAS
jgi:pilus assembly protein Flp/PilA